MGTLKVSVETAAGYGEILADALAGITGGCEVDDPVALADDLARLKGRWDYLEDGLLGDMERPATVRFYIEDDDGGQAILAEARALLDVLREQSPEAGSLNLTAEPMENQDWAIAWRMFFKPFPVGRRLWVRPSWEALAGSEGRAVLTIDPSSSFGTGSHATTRMCLEALDGLNLDGKAVLDLGCGSGILACGALILGAERAVCCDIEANAVTATRENMARNSIANHRFTVKLGDILTQPALCAEIRAGGPYDVITANIVADVLIPMAPLLGDFLAADGTLILSGIIDRRADAVADAYQACGWRIAARQTEADWVCMIASRV
jgi:ribosomal protein L11 methyltransferase